MAPFLRAHRATLRVAGAAALIVVAAASPRGDLFAAGPALTADEVRTALAAAAGAAAASGLRAHVAVTDAEGHVLGVFRMDGAPALSRVAGRLGEGLEGMDVPAAAVAIGKAATAALLSSGGNAFSSRTASFIVQQNFPPGVEMTPGGPLFGVQFSSLGCGDFKAPGVPLGLSGDPGGVPLYKEGVLVGGVAVEGDGVYAVDENPADADVSAEEGAALAGARGLETPDAIRADRILADGIRLPFVNGGPVTAAAAAPGVELVAPMAGVPSAFVATSLGGVAGRSDPRFPIRAGSVLTADAVAGILEHAAQQAARTRAAIRQPMGSSARVSIAVVDTDGAVLGFFQLDDAPNFGIDVAVQKARTASFFSGPGAGDDLRRAGLALYVQGGLPLDGSVAYTTRAIGFVAQPYFPPGIAGTDPGPLAPPIAEWSPFHTGLQTELVREAIVAGAAGTCTPAIPRLPNGITLFPGGVPLAVDGRLAGAIGVSGDGVDQDDLIATAGANGFEIPAPRRSDQLVLRGVRLPWVKFPRHPEL